MEKGSSAISGSPNRSETELEQIPRHANVETGDNGIVTLTLSDAGPLNILGTPAIVELRRTVADLSKNPDIRVLIVRGTGDKGFVGGADIKEMAALTRESAETFIGELRGLCDSLRHFPAPVIARMPGWCLGGGLELALACDIRIASHHPKPPSPHSAVFLIRKTRQNSSQA